MKNIREIETNIVYDVLVVGLGPSAISSAIYSARKELKTAIIGRILGGQITETNEIENIIGITTTTGKEFSDKLQEHLETYPIYTDYKNLVEKIELENDLKRVYTSDGNSYLTKTVIIATGAKWKKLNVKGEKEFTGLGVHYCATCDAPFYRNLKVVVVGGGNSGVEASLDLSKIAKEVTLIEFTDTIKADGLLTKKLYATENIKVITNASLDEIKGNQFVTSISYINRLNNEKIELDTDGVFVEIGLVANTSFVEGLLELNSKKEIITKDNMTNIPGIFAAGDCRDTTNKQIIIAMGDGANASLNAYSYLLNK